MTKTVLIQVAKFSLVGGILYYLYATDRLNLEKLLLLAQSGFLLVAILGTFLFVLLPLNTLRWSLLLKGLGVKIPFKSAFLLTWTGFFFNTILPGAVSGDVVKGYYLDKMKLGMSKTELVVSLVIDRLVGLFGLIFIGMIGLLSNLEWIQSDVALMKLGAILVFLFAGTLTFYAVILMPSLRKNRHRKVVKYLTMLPMPKFLKKVYLAFKKYEHHKSILLYTLLLSIGIHLITSLIFIYLAREIGILIQLSSQMTLMPLGLITISLPIAPAGIGVGHIAFETLYSLAGSRGGADVFNLFVATQVSIYLLGFIPYLLLSRLYPKNQTTL